MIIECWSCGASMTLAEHGASDGYCPECEVEIDLAENFPKLLAERDELRARLLRIASCDPARRSIEWAMDQASLCDNSAWLQWKEASDRCEALAAELATAKSRNADLTQHKTDYMEAAEQTRKALEVELATLKAGAGEAVVLQHMAVSEGGVLRWMTGRSADDCELYAMPDFGRAPALYTNPPTAPDVSGLVAYATFCAYCGGNDEHPQDHCMDCTRPRSIDEVSELVSALRQARTSMLDSGYRADSATVMACDQALAKFAQGGGNV